MPAGGGRASSCLAGGSLGPPTASSAMGHILGSGASSLTAALAAFRVEQNEAGMETGDELEVPSVTAIPVGFGWTRLSGSG